MKKRTRQIRQHHFYQRLRTEE